MKNKEEKVNVTVIYNDDEKAKERFIEFIVDYFLEKKLFRKVDSHEEK